MRTLPFSVFMSCSFKFMSMDVILETNHDEIQYGKLSFEHQEREEG